MHVCITHPIVNDYLRLCRKKYCCFHHRTPRFQHLICLNNSGVHVKLVQRLCLSFTLWWNVKFAICLCGAESGMFHANLAIVWLMRTQLLPSTSITLWDKGFLFSTRSNFIYLRYFTIKKWLKYDTFFLRPIQHVKGYGRSVNNKLPHNSYAMIHTPLLAELLGQLFSHALSERTTQNRHLRSGYLNSTAQKGQIKHTTMRLQLPAG